MKKLTRLLLKRLHEGYLIERIPTYRLTSRTDFEDVWGLLSPQYADPAEPETLEDCVDPPKDVARHFPLDRGEDLVADDLIDAVDDFSPRVYCLTPSGYTLAVQLFGPAPTPLLVRAADPEMDIKSANLQAAKSRP